MKRSKQFKVEDAYALFPDIQRTLKQCSDFNITVRKVVVEYEIGKSGTTEFSFLIGEKLYQPQLWTHRDLRIWLDKQKSYIIQH